MTEPQRVLFVGGGSIGHIAPSVAVARALRELKPDVSIHFVCSDRGSDALYIEKKGFSFSRLPAPRLSMRFPWQFFSAAKIAREFLRELRPSVIFSKGGYVSLPVCFAARGTGIPVILHESDAVQGYANRLAEHWSAHVCLGLRPERPLRRKEVFTGNPIDPEATRGSRTQGFSLTGLSPDRPILLVLGGSQGAQALNEAVTRHLSALLSLCQVVHLTGKGKEAHAGARPGYWSTPFVIEELPHLYAIANLALSRAGAGAIAELSANGIPAILVPLRHVAHDHQVLNAKRAASSGGCLLLEQEALPQELPNVIEQLVNNQEKLKEMRSAIGTLSSPDATRQIAELLAQYLA